MTAVPDDSARAAGWTWHRCARRLLESGLSAIMAAQGGSTDDRGAGGGRVVFGYPRSRIAEDFDVSRGRLLGFGMLALVAAPWLAHRWRGA